MRVPWGARELVDIFELISFDCSLYALALPHISRGEPVPSRFVASRLIGMKAKKERARPEGKGDATRTGRKTTTTTTTCFLMISELFINSHLSMCKTCETFVHEI